MATLFKPANTPDLVTKFQQECPSQLWDIVKKNNIKVKFFQHGEFYLVMLSAFNDPLLIELGKRYNFPRGFPILWIPGKLYHSFGFYPKFDNDDRQTPDNLEEFNDVIQVRFFEKWSGFLGQVIAWKFNDKVYWTITSKNSADCNSEFVQDAIRLMTPHMTSHLVNDMAKNHIHFCCEMISQKDQVHGARVLTETPIVTAIGKGCIHYLDKLPENSIVQEKFVNFFDHQSIINYCRQFGLPCGSAIVIENKDNVMAFMQELSNNRDCMTLTKLKEIFTKASAVKYIQGTIDHMKVLGDCLEGLVLHLTRNNGTSFIKKYKFPNYTIRTMLLRTQFVKFVLCNNLKKTIQWFVNNWCVTEDGKKYWSKFAYMAFMIKSNFQSQDSLVGIHIQIADHILQHFKTIPDDIEDQFNNLCKNLVHGTIILCIGPIGTGKTQYMKKVCQLCNGVPIDGDELNFGSNIVMRLGQERGDYSLWCIIQTLMEGKIPVISAGGGIFFNFKDQFILRERIQNALGISIKIVTLITGKFDKVGPLDINYDPSDIYNNKALIDCAISHRLKINEWKLDQKYKTEQNFIDFIFGKSKTNLKFAQTVVKNSDYVFGVPYIAPDNYDQVIKTIDLTCVSPCIKLGAPLHQGRFNQIRLLMDVQSTDKQFQQIGHVTWMFDMNGMWYNLNDFDKLMKFYPEKVIKGKIIEMSNGKNKILFAVPDQSIHEDGSTHVTLNPGNHQPVQMKTAAHALRTNEVSVDLPDKNNKSTITYKVSDRKETLCTLTILSAFGI